MNRRTISIGAQIRRAWSNLSGIAVQTSEPAFHGICIESDMAQGIRMFWAMDLNEMPMQPHEARALGEALIAAADDVAAYKVKP